MNVRSSLPFIPKPLADTHFIENENDFLEGHFAYVDKFVRKPMRGLLLQSKQLHYRISDRKELSFATERWQDLSGQCRARFRPNT